VRIRGSSPSACRAPKFLEAVSLLLRLLKVANTPGGHVSLRRCGPREGRQRGSFENHARPYRHWPLFDLISTNCNLLLIAHCIAVAQPAMSRQWSDSTSHVKQTRQDKKTETHRLGRENTESLVIGLGPSSSSLSTRFLGRNFSATYLRGV